MKANIYIIFLLLLHLAKAQASVAEKVLINSQTIHENNFWMGKHMMVYWDRSGKLTFEEVSGVYAKEFKKPSEVVPLLSNDGHYWIKVVIKKTTNDPYFWLFECYDQSIDDIEFYAKDAQGNYFKQSSGELHTFSSKAYQHKNLLFELNFASGQEQEVYFKVKDKFRMSMIGAIRNHRSLMNYALSEYFFLSLFYGLVACMLLVAIAYYFSTHKRIYLYYLAYLIAVGAFALCTDGMGFQFIWGEYPTFNNELREVASLGVIAVFFFFIKGFLGENKPPKWIEASLLAILFIRVVFFVIKVTTTEEYFSPTYLDILVRGLLCYAVYAQMRSGKRQYRFLWLAITCVLIGYAVRELAILNVLPNNVITIYMNLFGESLQMIFITIALSEQLKIQLEVSVKQQETAIREMEKMHAETEQIKNSLQDQVNEQVAQEKFLSEGLSKLNGIIANYQQEPELLYQHLSSFIANQFNFGMVALYAPDMQEQHAVLKSGYSLDEYRLDHLNASISTGLIGQCLKNKERIVLENIPQNYLSIGSGLGGKAPVLIIIEPLLFNNKLVGILEYASFHELTKLELELLHRVTGQISSVLSYTTFSELTGEMLERSRAVEAELKQQVADLTQQLSTLELQPKKS
ncbi:MAG: GAF domain-containing protein [Cytophagaceae bacterium]|jgi:hypothetical protein|nr:GAF domain-containing protein [Cytophagaceae bacterium]